MIRTLLCTSASMLSVPAIAQQSAPSQANPNAAAATADPQAATPAEGAQAAPAQAQAQPAATSVASIVETEFPAYDADKSGQLEKTEFSKWMLALKDQEMKATGKTLPAAEVAAWATGAFASADADKSSSVTKDELVKYLSGGA